ncbi:uroplakin-3a [Leptodactylus fuscus]|uniref:uroplakin-3a n=1 Tax=Leptodactylus fuscus TaxID=238119 RepID=UPI003F4F3A03
MGACRCLLVFLAVLLQNDLARAEVPLLCSSSVCRVNPTQNTVALQKSYCFYQGPATVVLYVVQDSAPTNITQLNNTFYTTNGGSTAPYVAGTFDNLVCGQNPTISDISTYVYRVGNNDNCFGSKYCNKPLASNTVYRFMYVFYDASNIAVTQTGWSAPITTKNAKAASNIDTWPGGRSGGMIVLTSILSVLTFLLLTALVAAMITYLMSPEIEQDPVIHETRSTHVPQRPEGPVSSAEETERYSSTLH